MSMANIPGAPERYSFAKISEPVSVPGLLDVRSESFAWLVGTQEWRERQRAERGDDAPPCAALGCVQQ